MKVSWLHVSDFHFRAGQSYDREIVLRALVDSVARFREKGRRPDLIFATGDLAYSGKEAEYRQVTLFLDRLLEAAGLERRHLFVVPGNHDVDRDRGVALKRTLSSGEEADDFFDPATPWLHLEHKLGAYRAWYEQYFEGIRQLAPDSTCGPVETIDVGGGTLAVLPIDSALFCQDDHDHEKLWVGRRCLGAAIGDVAAASADLTVALIHHPLSWLDGTERANVKATLQRDADFVLRGHLHEQEYAAVLSPQGGAIHLAAGACYQTRRWPQTATYASVEDDRVRLFPIRYEDQPEEVWTVDPSLYPDAEGYEGELALPSAPPPPASAMKPEAAIPSTPRPASFRGNIPSRRELPFEGRDHLLDALAAELADTRRERIVVLHGGPGVGKSELAREYGRRYLERYPGGTFLIDAGSGLPPVDLARLGRTAMQLEVPPGLSVPEQCEFVLYALGTAPTLLIYDNARTGDRIDPWLPPSGMPCHAILTAHSPDWGPAFKPLEVPPLRDGDAAALVLALAGEEAAAVFGKELVRQSGGLPVHICSTAISLASDYRRGRLGQGATDVSKETATGFQRAVQRLSPEARLVLRAAALLNPRRIPVEELRHHLVAGASWDEQGFTEAIDECSDVHLIEGTDELRMHGLLSQYLLGMTDEAEEQTLVARVREVQADRFVELARSLVASPADASLAANLAVYPLSPDDWDHCGQSLPADGLNAVGEALLEIGQFSSALPWSERAVEAKGRGDVHGRVDHGSLGSSLHQVGYCLSEQGNYREALSWYERAVEAKKKGDVHGRIDQESLGASLHQVGNCHSRQGDYAEALPWYERAVEAAEKGDVHGRVDHESLGKSLSLVGYCHSEQGDYTEALPWYKRAIEAAEKGDVHGRVDHDSLGRSLHLVGYCHSQQGKYTEALPWYGRAVETKRKGDVHGRVDHASLGKSLHQAGYCHSKQGDYTEALPWYERAVDAMGKGDVHGRVDHESLKKSMRRLASTLRELGRKDEAAAWDARARDLNGSQGD